MHSHVDFYSTFLCASALYWARKLATRPSFNADQIIIADPICTVYITQIQAQILIDVPL